MKTFSVFTNRKNCYITYRNEQKKSEFMVESDKSDEEFLPPIYNFISSSTNPVTWGDYSYFNKKHGKNIPTVKAVRVLEITQFKCLSIKYLIY